MKGSLYSSNYGAELVSISAALVLPPGYLKGVFASLIKLIKFDIL